MNEPVAWMTAKGIQDVCTVNEKEEMGNDFDDYIIPLYTHPHSDKSVKAKTLTDEEITQVFDECYPNNADGDVVTLIDFARAILRKAQDGH